MVDIATALGVFNIFKEVVLLLGSVSSTIQRLQVELSLSQNLLEDFRKECLQVESFGRCFLQEDCKLDRTIVEESWLNDVGDTLEQLRAQCNDYTILAREQDEIYRRFSPFVNSSGMPMDEIWPAEELSCDTSHRLDSGACLGTEGLTLFWTPKKLQKVLQQTQSCTERLISIVPIIMAIHPRFKGLTDNVKGRDAFLNSETARSLNAVPHLLIREITMRLVLADRELILQNSCRLEGPEQGSGLATGHLSTEMATEPVLFEYKWFRQASDPEQSVWGRRELFQLAQLLKEASSEQAGLHTLRLRGVLDQSTTHKRFAFVFEAPRDTDPARLQPISLHSIMANQMFHSNVSLPNRFRLAQTLATTVAKLHADGWMHRNIRSHSVVFFHAVGCKATEPVSVNNPYLVDFENARPIGAQTSYNFHADLERNMYRHPQRQGPPTEYFEKRHDVYALGVVLLEIGLWKPVMEIFAHQTGAPATDDLSPRKIQQILLDAAKEWLPFYMGQLYSDAVVNCLSDGFGMESLSSDSEVMFVEKIVRNLDIIRL